MEASHVGGGDWLVCKMYLGSSLECGEISGWMECLGVAWEEPCVGV